MNIKAIILVMAILALTRLAEAGFRSRLVKGTFELALQTRKEIFYQDCAKRPFFRLRRAHFLKLQSKGTKQDPIIVSLRRKKEAKKNAEGLRCHVVIATIDDNKVKPGTYSVTPLNRSKRPLKYYASLPKDLVVKSDAAASSSSTRPSAKQLRAARNSQSQKRQGASAPSPVITTPPLLVVPPPAALPETALAEMDKKLDGILKVLQQRDNAVDEHLEALDQQGEGHQTTLAQHQQWLDKDHDAIKALGATITDLHEKGEKLEQALAELRTNFEAELARSSAATDEKVGQQSARLNAKVGQQSARLNAKIQSLSDRVNELQGRVAAIPALPGAVGQNLNSAGSGDSMFLSSSDETTVASGAGGGLVGVSGRSAGGEVEDARSGDAGGRGETNDLSGDESASGGEETANLGGDRFAVERAADVDPLNAARLGAQEDEQPLADRRGQDAAQPEAGLVEETHGISDREYESRQLAAAAGDPATAATGEEEKDDAAATAVPAGRPNDPADTAADTPARSAAEGADQSGGARRGSSDPEAAARGPSGLALTTTEATADVLPAAPAAAEGPGEAAEGDTTEGPGNDAGAREVLGAAVATADTSGSAAGKQPELTSDEFNPDAEFILLKFCAGKPFNDDQLKLFFSPVPTAGRLPFSGRNSKKREAVEVTPEILKIEGEGNCRNLKVPKSVKEYDAMPVGDIEVKVVFEDEDYKLASPIVKPKSGKRGMKMSASGVAGSVSSGFTGLRGRVSEAVRSKKDTATIVAAPADNDGNPAAAAPAVAEDNDPGVAAIATGDGERENGRAAMSSLELLDISSNHNMILRFCRDSKADANDNGGDDSDAVTAAEAAVIQNYRLMFVKKAKGFKVWSKEIVPSVTESEDATDGRKCHQLSALKSRLSGAPKFGKLTVTVKNHATGENISPSLAISVDSKAGEVVSIATGAAISEVATADTNAPVPEAATAATDPAATDPATAATGEEEKDDAAATAVPAGRPNDPADTAVAAVRKGPGGVEVKAKVDRIAVDDDKMDDLAYEFCMDDASQEINDDLFTFLLSPVRPRIWRRRNEKAAPLEVKPEVTSLDASINKPNCRRLDLARDGYFSKLKGASEWSVTVMYGKSPFDTHRKITGPVQK